MFRAAMSTMAMVKGSPGAAVAKAAAELLDAATSPLEGAAAGRASSQAPPGKPAADDATSAPPLIAPVRRLP